MLWAPKLREYAAGRLGRALYGAFHLIGPTGAFGGDAPERSRSEAAFANPCGAAPIPASVSKVPLYVAMTRLMVRRLARALFSQSQKGLLQSSLMPGEFLSKP